MSEVAASTPPAPAPFAPPVRPAMPAQPPVLTSQTSSRPAAPPPPPTNAPLSFAPSATSTTSTELPAAPRRASSITGGIPRQIGSLDAEVEPSLPRPRPSTRIPTQPAQPTQTPAADVNAVLSALGVADAPKAPPPPPSTVSLQHVATRALQIAGVGVLVGAAAFAAFTFRDGPASWSFEQRRQLVDTWLRTNAWGRVRSDEVVAAVSAIGATVVPAALKTEARFVVVDGPQPRAEALPDGTVVVTTATLRSLATDAELAAVLAHALAHASTGERQTRLDASEHARSAQRALQSSNPHTAAAVVDEVLAVSDTVDEGAIATSTQRLLESGGWQPHAFGDAVAKLQAQRGWHAALSPALAHTLEQMPKTGRASAEHYGRDVLDRVGHQR